MQHDVFVPLTLAHLVFEDFERIVRSVECAIDRGVDDSRKPISGYVDLYDRELAFHALLRRDIYQSLEFLFACVERNDGGTVNFAGTQSRLHSELLAIWEAAAAIERAAKASR